MQADSGIARVLPDSHPLSRPGRLLLSLIAVVSMAMIGVVWVYYNNQRAANEDAAQREVFAVTEVESAQILNWRRERQGNGHVLMSSPLNQLARSALTARPLSAATHAELLDLMTRLAEAFDYSDIMLVDLDGSVVERLHASSTTQSPLRQALRRSLTTQAVQAHEVVLSDLFPNDRTNSPLMGMSVPVGNSGALILVIDPSHFLYPLLNSWPGHRQTAEALLQQREGDEAVFLSPLRFPTKFKIFSRRPIPIRLPDMATLDAGWPDRANDYRGVPVIGVIRHIKGTSWYLVCKIDLAEVDAPIHRLGWEMAALATLIGLAAIIGGGGVWRAQQARYFREREEEIRSFSARLLQAREDERKRLALELHDDVNQQLAAVNLGLANLQRLIPAGDSEVESQSVLIHRQLLQVTDAIRRISHDLHPAILEISGLGAAIRSCCAEFEALTKIRVDFTADGDFAGISPAVSLAFYRILQEALQNVAKHADSESVRVDLRRAGSVLLLTVSDSGKGISSSIARTRTGLGLLGIRERARLAGGDVSIRSAPNEGTTVIVRVNLDNSASLAARQSRS